MEEVWAEGGMVIKKLGQGLCGCDGAEQDRKKQPDRAGRAADLEWFSAALVKLRSYKSVPFQSSNPWTGV
jgi:hypothetical protein